MGDEKVKDYEEDEYGMPAPPQVRASAVPQPAALPWGGQSDGTGFGCEGLYVLEEVNQPML